MKSTSIIARSLLSILLLTFISGCKEIQIEDLQPIADYPEMSCQKYTIPVGLKTTGLKLDHVTGTLCWEGELEGKTIQLLLSGAGYGEVYWDFPYQPETYSYVRSAVRAGYATFNLSRIGIGASSKPFGILVNVDANVAVIQQVIECCLRENSVSGTRFGPPHYRRSFPRFSNGRHSRNNIPRLS